MEFLKNHGEKLLLLVLAAGLAFSVLGVLNARGAFQSATDVDMREASIVLDTAEVERTLSLITTNAPELATALGSFTPEIRKSCANPDHGALIAMDADICPYCGYEQSEAGIDLDEDGIPDKQELAWGMDPEEPGDAYEDMDGDGFITLVEYQLGTDPTNSSEHPPLIDYVRLAELDQKSVRFELTGFSQTTARDYTLQLRWAYPGQRRWSRGYVKTGERFGRNNEFRALRFVEKRTQRDDGTWKDESHAVIQVGRHTLKLGRYGEDAKGRVTESLATLRLIAGPDWEEQVRVGGSFELDKKIYNIVDILDTAVVVMPQGAESTISIGKPAPGEEEKLSPSAPETDPERPTGGPEIILEDFQL